MRDERKGSERGADVRRTLMAQQRQILGRVARHEGELRWLDEDIESEVVEEGQERTIARLLERLDQHERAELAAIERALDRLERGTYGVCSACGNAIPPSRLRALPTAETCIPCAALREQVSAAGTAPRRR
jgi:RNA polymerase-binding transcription factor DksA